MPSCLPGTPSALSRSELYSQHARVLTRRRAGVDRVAGGAPQPARAGRLHPRPVGLPRSGPGGRPAGAGPPARDRGAGGCVPGALGGGAGAGGAGRGHRLGCDCAGNRTGAAGGAGDGRRHLAAAHSSWLAANGADLGLEVEWLESDLLAAVAGRQFDLIVSNPPYIAAAELETLEPEVRRVGAAPRDHSRAGRTGAAAGAGAVGAGSARRRRDARAGVRRRARPAPWSRRWPPAAYTDVGVRRGLRRHRAVRDRAAAVSRAEQVALLLAGELAILPTDTVYGIACAAAVPAAVERLYALKQRPPDAADGAHAGVGRGAALRRRPGGSRAPSALLLASVLPGPITLVIPNPARRFAHAVRRRSRPASGCACPG